VGRLDDITERNQRENRRSRQRVWFAATIFALVVISIVLAIYTDLGAPAPVDRSHANGIELRRAK
jgi:hypothetical protein